jgi:hypothetical protein
MAISESEDVERESVSDNVEELNVLAGESEIVSSLPDDSDEEISTLPSEAVEGPSDSKQESTNVGDSASEASKLEGSVYGDTSVSGSREIGISSVVHLMGLATKKHLDAIEQQMAAISTKIVILGGKVERVGAQLQSMQSAAALDRLDAQLSDIQKALKQISNVSGATISSSVTPQQADKRSAPKILVSTPQEVASSTPIDADGGDVDSLASASDLNADEESLSSDEKAQSQADIEFQKSQADRMRKQNSEK